MNELARAVALCPSVSPNEETQRTEGWGLAFYLVRLADHDHVELRTYGDADADFKSVSPPPYILSTVHGVVLSLVAAFRREEVSRPRHLIWPVVPQAEEAEDRSEDPDDLAEDEDEDDELEPDAEDDFHDLVDAFTVRWSAEGSPWPALQTLNARRARQFLLTYKELGQEIQERSGIRTKALLHNWIGSVLGKVVREAHRRGDPPLTALVVHSDDGMVGEGYKEVLQVAGQPPVHEVLEREQHAAAARLDCYRRFSANLPSDGGVPALAPKHQAAIDRRRVHIAEPPPVCARCFVQLPATRVCDSCS